MRRAEFQPEGETVWQLAAAIPELQTPQERLADLKRRWKGVGTAAIFAAVLPTFGTVVAHHWAFTTATMWEGVERNALEDIGRLAGATGWAAGLLMFAVRVMMRGLASTGVPDPLTRPGGRQRVWYGVAAPAAAYASSVVWVRQAALSDRHDSWTAYARRAVARFAERAWRRPVTPAEVDRLAAIATAAQKRGDGFDAAVKSALLAALNAKSFLYLEEGNAAAPSATLTDWQVAARLSYFLWGTTPDERLSGLARDGTLRKPDVRRGEVRRILADPKDAAFAESFPRQWPQLLKVGMFARTRRSARTTTRTWKRA